MARIARVVVPGFPHHVVQRGNRRQQVFFCDNDCREYLKLLRDHAVESDLEVLSYCLMPNHVHLIVVPKKNESLARAIGETHRKYTRMINFRENWRGYLWQGRFGSYVLDERYLLAATRYILHNPVRAKIAKNVRDYKWSSARHHLNIGHNPLLNNTLLNSLVKDWKEFLKVESTKEDISLFRKHECTGRPLGEAPFVDKLESIIGRTFKKKKPGPRKHNN
jgi:putative transposase